MMRYIRETYQVSAKRGARISFEGKPGTIVGSSGAYLIVHIDGVKKTIILHPTYNIIYNPKEEN